MNVPLNIDWQQIVLHLLNFVVLFAVLYFLLYAPVKNFMDKRSDYYKNMDDEARKNLEQSEKLKNEYEEKLSLAEEEIRKNKQEANRLISEKTEQTENRARLEAEKIISDARRRAENDRNKLLENARNDIADLVADAAEKVAGGATASEAYDSFLNSVKRSDG